MMRLWAIVLFVLTCALPAQAEDALWVEAEGFGFAVNNGDVESARRRALMDALLNASLAGGAAIQAHSAVSLARVERDLLIVQPTGRVLQHDIIGQSLQNNTWRVTVRALVGNDTMTICQAANRLHVITYAPQIRVSPAAPFWTEQLAQDVVQSLFHVLDRHHAVDSLRITDRPMPRGVSDSRAARDYVTLTQGDVRLTAGDFGFAPDLSISVVADGRAQAAELHLTLALVSSDGEVTRQEIVRQTRLPRPSLLGNAAVLTQRTREQMASDLTQGLTQAFDHLLSVQSCAPLSTTLALSGSDLSVNLGSRQGLSRGAVAFTVDRDNSVEMLEIVTLSDRSATLRPMDPTKSAQSFAGRPVRFLDTGL